MLNCLTRLFMPDAAEREVAELYTQLVQESRDPRLFVEFAVPDTLEGRFDMIVLHLFLALEKEKHRRAPEAYQRWSRQLADRFFADMDRNLREMGAGDVGVGRKVQQMGTAYFGRLKAYGASKTDSSAMAQALARNVYGSAEAVETPPVQAFTAYVMERLRQPVAAESKG